jgi:hypothetical protein
MPSHLLIQELREFVQFATHRLERGGRVESVEDLVQEWRTDSEFAGTVADVRQGMVDKAAGLSEPADQVFADIRRQLGLPQLGPSQ